MKTTIIEIKFLLYENYNYIDDGMMILMLMRQYANNINYAKNYSRVSIS